VTSDRALKVLAFVATGVGVVGFVIFVGAAILWVRFKALGLPANQATALVTRADLVVTGATFLVPAVLFAFAAILILFALDWLMNAWSGRFQTQLFNPAAGSRRDWGDSLDGRRTRLARYVAVSFWVAVVTAGAVFYYGDALGSEAIVLRAGAVALLAVVVVTVVLRTGNFLYFVGLAAVLILVGASLITYERTYQQPKIEPAAVIFDIGSEAARKDGQGKGQAVAGLLIADTPDFIYLGVGTRAKIDSNRGRIFSIERSRVTDMSIGPLMKAQKALKRAPQLAAELCAHGAVKRRRCPRLNPVVPVRVANSPSLSNVSLHPTVLRPARRRASFRYYLSTQATMTFTFWHASKGRRANDDEPCARRLRAGARCNVFRRFGPRLIEARKKGGGHTRTDFSGRLGGRRLEPGLYRVTVVARTGRFQSRPANVHLRVVR
jgi:hypothetical protein